jgi:hypothetical protein
MWRTKKKVETGCSCGCQDIWKKYGDDPRLRCPKCGGVAGIPSDLGLSCFRCSMRYSPVTKRRYGRAG